jgi:hypothetical protein
MVVPKSFKAMGLLCKRLWELPEIRFAVWAVVSVNDDGARAPRMRRFGNVGELRLREASVKEGGVIRGTFTVRGFEF